MSGPSASGYLVIERSRPDLPPSYRGLYAQPAWGDAAWVKFSELYYDDTRVSAMGFFIDQDIACSARKAFESEFGERFEIIFATQDLATADHGDNFLGFDIADHGGSFLSFLVCAPACLQRIRANPLNENGLVESRTHAEQVLARALRLKDEDIDDPVVWAVFAAN